MNVKEGIYRELYEVCVEKEVPYSVALESLFELNFDAKVSYQELLSEMRIRHSKECSELMAQRSERLSDHCTTVIQWVEQGML